MLNRGGPTTGLSEPAKITRFFFCELAPRTGDVFEVLREVFRNLNLITWVEVEVFARGIPRQMRMEDPAG